jgi:hypothetical protein
MSKPALNGLGAVQRIARERRESGQSETLAAAERG